MENKESQVGGDGLALSDPLGKPKKWAVGRQYETGSNALARAITARDHAQIGIVLCNDQGADLVRCTLPLRNKRIFAAKYKLHLPSEQELIAELRRERTAIEDAQLVTKLDQGETSRIKKSAFGTDGKSVRMV